MKAACLLILVGLTATAAGCGQKGPLVLPDAQHPRKKVKLPNPPKLPATRSAAPPAPPASEPVPPAAPATVPPAPAPAQPPGASPDGADASAPK